MAEFNPDGSLKLPERFARIKEENKEKLNCQRCIKISRMIISPTSPKKCAIHITLSEVLTDNRFIENIYNEFSENASVPSRLKKIDEKHFEIEIGTDFRRCTDCTSLINRYREFLDGNIIEDRGGCTFEGFKRNFSYEDYFE
jgi:hypothetical protein